jgi:hypothetical protein
MTLSAVNKGVMDKGTKGINKGDIRGDGLHGRVAHHNGQYSSSHNIYIDCKMVHHV